MIVDVVLPVCEPGPYERDRLMELLRVELAPLGVATVRSRTDLEAGSVPSEDDLLATIVARPESCESTGDAVTLEIIDHASKKRVERRMVVGDVEREARPRALALAIVELLGASWAELMMESRQTTHRQLPIVVRDPLSIRLQPPPTEASPALEEPQASEDGRRTLHPTNAGAPRNAARSSVHAPPIRLDARVLFWALPSRGTSLFGGQAAASYAPHGALRLFLAADGTAGDTRVAQGTVELLWLAGTLGLDVVASKGAELAIGPRLRTGFARASGDAVSDDVVESSQSEATLAFLLGANLRVPISGNLAASVALDVGHSVIGVDFLADDQRAAGIAGAMMGLGVGFSAAL